jgi:hypothetical protein
MIPRRLLHLFVVAIASGGVRCWAAESGVEFFEKRIRPVLAEHCYECHSAEAKKLKGKLRLDAREDILRGGETGPALIPGNPDKSLLITAVKYTDKDLQMPPPIGETSRKLSDNVIADFIHWVQIGAPMPKTRIVKNETEPTKQHWAFIAPTQPALPNIKNEAWIKTPIDRLILAKLESNNLHPAAAADKRTLIRRATFDLTGLPPKIEHVEAFLRDNSKEAYTKVIERLLASPEYGERWARHWLDVARYADTKGYVYDREERFFVHSWTYRDWIVRAFNNDMPYDRFLKLQIAADQIAPPRSPDLAAMGFITGGRRFIGITREIIDDRIDVVTRGTMALTVACARCHDHKYDPIPTRDYYSLYGVFEPGVDQLINLGAEPTDEEFLKRSNKYKETMQKRREEAAARLRARVGDYLTAQLELHKYPDEGFDQLFSDTDILPASVRRWRDYLHRTKDSFHSILAPWHALSKIPADEFDSKAKDVLEETRRNEKLNPLVASAFETPPKSLREAADRYGALFKAINDKDESTCILPGADDLARFLYDPRSPTTVPDTGIVSNEQFFPTSVCEELWKLSGDVDRWLIKNNSSPHARVVIDREPERNPRVFIRGNPARLGDEVPRQFLQVVAGPNRHPFERGSGRLELAQAIASPQNPLTARVMVNRIWLGHFGSGLVKTPSDFGLRAEPPSHPELLDWLAIQFMDSGWSIKAMHRVIMFSSTYQQSSIATPVPSDPDNRLLSHFPRARLDLEETRDAMLAATGELQSKIGGKPSELLTPTNTRRTLYGLVDRQFLPATFRMFDFANPDIHVGQRHTTTVPQQALFFLNNPFIAERARTLANFDEKTPPEKRVRDLYEKIYQRPPTKLELSEGLEFVAASAKDTPPPAPKYFERAWQYGWGEYDKAAKKVKSFNKLPHFTGDAWQGGSKWPDEKLGWLQLTATGGHPGNDLKHAAIRRWTSPVDAKISIGARITHEPEAGDGIRAYIVSNRAGELTNNIVHHATVEMSATGIEVKAGDTIDFIVDIRDNLNSDQFLWAPIIASWQGSSTFWWDADREFQGPNPNQLDPLQPWAQYAQTLLLANEFSFVD